MPMVHGTAELIDVGSGPDGIICLHGWCCRTGDFADQVEALANRHRVLVPDWQQRMVQRGDGYSFQGICKDIVELARQRGMRCPLLCGHSMGGFLAAYLAKDAHARSPGAAHSRQLVAIARFHPAAVPDARRRSRSRTVR